ncbi:olfactory receptor 12-like [Terrapene carolina triunguis]|uniref:olfactory receptor 12-like n=1 Tax=Terrapene triunguis TaxID=2587831 RepID=UPI0011563301|nr:olfactory receptor 12-like [Terrapene carolina triunguis]
MSATEPVREGNHTAETEFILLGFGRGLWMEMFPFVMFLVIYIITVLGNTILVLIIGIDSQLHSPMYFFLMNLSLLDLGNSSSIAPRAMVSFLLGSKAISYNGCATQFFFVTFFLTTEGFLLAAMAYDRYSAIRNPLRYPITMSKWVCIWLVVGSYICGCVNSMVQTGFTFTLDFCGSNEMDHFFCDGPPLISLSCSDTFVNNIVIFTLCGLIIVSTALITLLSYVYIISTILRIHSAEGRHRAFSTCTSHLVVLTLFYVSTALMYAQPTRLAFLYPRKVVSIFYTLFAPMLNPFIYSLRNKDVKDALRRTMSKKCLKK